MAIALNIPPSETVSTTEAIWALIANQRKSVQKILASRLASLLSEEDSKAQKAYVRDTLTHALNEARQAHASGKPLPDARRLFDDLDD